MPDALNPTWPVLRAALDDLRSARGELAELENKAREQRAAAIMASQTDSVSGRDREADLAVLDIAPDITNVRCVIAQGEDLVRFLYAAIEHDVDVTTLGVR